MRCPACGHEERTGTVCSQCATPLPAVEQKAETETPSLPKQPVTPPSPSTPKEGKHRSRPLHDLDLTLPELEVQHLESPKPKPLPGLPSAQGVSRLADLAQARELIDLLGLLEEKTKGNLTPEESERLQQTLYSLRMKFI